MTDTLTNAPGPRYPAEIAPEQAKAVADGQPGA